MKIASFGSENQESPGNEERTPNAEGKFAYQREEGIFMGSLGCLKDYTVVFQQVYTESIEWIQNNKDHDWHRGLSKGLFRGMDWLLYQEEL